MIDFYNIQFYNQGVNTYTTYEDLFTNSVGYFSATSVQQIIERGISSRKIVLGKPATTSDASNGYVDPVDLGIWSKKAESNFGWNPCFMFWQYIKDPNGTIIQSAITGQ